VARRRVLKSAGKKAWQVGCLKKELPAAGEEQKRAGMTGCYFTNWGLPAMYRNEVTGTGTLFCETGQGWGGDD
jgi:hypothetical protein